MFEVLDTYPSISLDDMQSIRLMNRLDTKFVTNREKLCELLELAKNDYYVQDINGLHIIPYSTQYYDTKDNAMYLAHHNRRLTRQKVRVRTYMDSGLTFLEVKNKNNHRRTKKIRTEVTPDTTLDMGDLRKTLHNEFSRITLVNKGKTERLTIDFGLKFENMQTGKSNQLENIVIIELKRDGLVPSPIMEIIRQLRIKPSGFSKYCIGMAMTDDDLKKNNFKNKIRLIQQKLNN